MATESGGGAGSTRKTAGAAGVAVIVALLAWWQWPVPSSPPPEVPAPADQERVAAMPESESATASTAPDPAAGDATDEPAEAAADTVDAMVAAPAEDSAAADAPAPELVAEIAADDSTTITPAFDTFRHDVDGTAVIAGRAPGATAVAILIDGVEVDRAPVDAAGRFATVFDLAPAAVVRRMTLQGQSADGGMVDSLAELLVAPVVTAPDAATPATDAPPAPVELVADTPITPAEAAEVSEVAAELAPVGEDAQSAEGQAVDEGTSSVPAVADLAGESAEPEITPEAESITAAGQEIAALTPPTSPPPAVVAKAPAESPPAIVGTPDEVAGSAPMARLGATAPDAVPGAGTEPPADAAPATAATSAAPEIAVPTVGPVADAPPAALTSELRLAAGGAQDAEPQPKIVTVGDPAAPPASTAVATDQADSVPPGAAGITPPATPSALVAAPPPRPASLLIGESGVTVLRPVSDRRLAIDAIGYTADGGVQVSGSGGAEGVVRVYLNNQPVLEVPGDAQGVWRGDLAAVAPGLYSLRADLLDPAGTVVARAETPFLREAPDALAVISAAAPASAQVVTVQPGYTLWGIARRTYGAGIEYVKVFEANRDQIRNPHRIYPGQIFTLPALE